MQLLRIALVTTLVALGACTSAPAARTVGPDEEKAVMQRVESLLYRYANNDQPGVIALLDPQRMLMLGSNPGEVVRTPEELRAFMSRDFAQWQSASFTNIRDVDVRIGDTLATAYLMFDFSAANGPTIPIRFLSTWRKVNGEWLLSQGATSVMMGP